MPRTAIIANLNDGILIAVDSNGEIHDTTQQKPVEIISYSTEERLFYDDKIKLIILSLCPATVSNVFTKIIIRNFCKELGMKNDLISIHEIKELFVSFIKLKYPESYDIIFSTINLLLIKQDKDRLFFDRLTFTRDNDRYLLLKTNILQVQRNHILLADETNAKCQVDPNLICESAKNKIEGHFRMVYGRERIPITLLSLTNTGDFISLMRSYLEHPFKRLEDLILAFQHDYIGAAFHKNYTMSDIERSLFSVKAGTHDAMSQISTLSDNYAISLERFRFICRNRVSRYDNEFMIFYLNSYKFINELFHDSTLFKHKLETVLNHGVIIFLERSTKPNDTIIAFYNMESRCITLHADLMGKYQHDHCARIFKHEIEHAYKDIVHELRWKKHLATPQERKYVKAHGLNSAYFPNNDEERLKWLSIAHKVLKTAKKILALLEQQSNGSNLDENDQILLNRYSKAVKDYKAMNIAVPLQLQHDDPLNNPANQHKINSTNMVYKTNVTSVGMSIPLYVTRIIVTD